MPSPGSPDAVEVVRTLGGTATRAQITRTATEHSLRRAVAQGRLRRASRGVFTVPELGAASRTAAVLRGLVSHRSAADYWRLEALTESSAVHVTVPPGSRPMSRPSSRREVVVHFRDVPAADDSAGVTSPMRTVLDCAATLPFIDALAIADSALRLALVDHEELIAGAQRLPRTCRARVLRVVTRADGAAANPFESGLRAIAIEAGITTLVPQLRIETPQLVAHVDLGDSARMVVFEADSFAYHGSPEALQRDCRRYDELVCDGWLVLRFSWLHVMHDRPWVTDVITRAWVSRAPRRKTLKITT